MAEVDVRVCPKHPEQVMTLLFNTYVCDLCDPPTERIQFAGSGTSRETPPITVTIYPGAIGGGRTDSSSYLNWCRCGVQKRVSKTMCRRCRDVRFLTACVKDSRTIDLFESPYEHVLPWPWAPDVPSQVVVYAEDDLRPAMVAHGAEVGRWRNTLFGGTPDL